MRVPVQVTMGGRAVKISYVSQLLEDDGVPYAGEAAPFTDPPEIRISTTYPKDAAMVFKVWLHEATHIALGLLGLSATWTREREEPFAHGMELLLGDLLCLRPDAKGVRWREVAFAFEEQD